MRSLTSAEFGFPIDGGESIESLYAHNIASKQRNVQQQIPAAVVTDVQKTPQTPVAYISRLGNNNSIIISKSKIVMPKVEVAPVKESYLVPPEGEPDDEYDDDAEYGDSVAYEVQKLARDAARRLKAKNKHGKIGFLRRNSSGTTGYNFLKNSAPTNDTDQSLDHIEKLVTIGTIEKRDWIL